MGGLVKHRVALVFQYQVPNVLNRTFFNNNCGKSIVKLYTNDLCKIDNDHKMYSTIKRAIENAY